MMCVTFADGSIVGYCCRHYSSWLGSFLLLVCRGCFDFTYPGSACILWGGAGQRGPNLSKPTIKALKTRSKRATRGSNVSPTPPLPTCGRPLTEIPTLENVGHTPPTGAIVHRRRADSSKPSAPFQYGCEPPLKRFALTVDSGAIDMKNSETGHTADLRRQYPNQSRVVRHVQLSQREQAGHGAGQSSLRSTTVGR